MLLVNSQGSMRFHSDHKYINAPRYMYDRDITALEMLRLVLDQKPLVILEGGADINPKIYHAVNTHSYAINHRRDAFEIELYEAATHLGVPVLGICRGHQLLNALEGGTLYQDLEYEATGDHPGSHPIVFTAEAREQGFDRVMESFPYGAGTVNSYHHQGINRLAPTAIALATYKNVIEAVRFPRAIGVQWHPEFAGHLEMLDYCEAQFYAATA